MNKIIYSNGNYSAHKAGKSINVKNGINSIITF